MKNVTLEEVIIYLNSAHPRIQNEHAGCPIEAYRPKGRGSDVRQCFAPGKDLKYLLYSFPQPRPLKRGALLKIAVI